MPLDYLTSNALNKYPFDDSATLKAADDVYLPNDVFLDIVAVSKSEALVGGYISTLASSLLTEVLTIEFKFTDVDANVIKTFEIEVPFASVISREMYGLADDDVAVKVVFGVGAEEFITSTQSKTYSSAATKLAPSAFVLMVPQVKSISFFNWDQDVNTVADDPLVVVDGNVDVTIEEGANINIYEESGKNIMEVFSGAGTGLYDACGANELTIKTINDTGPDLNNNFLFVADDCYTSTPLTNGLELENICTPKCTPEQLAAFAHYLNRVNDGLLWVRNLASTTATAVRNEIDHYNDDVVPNKNQLSYKARFEKFEAVDAGKFYYSFAVGFTNPTNSDNTLSVTLTTSGTLVSSKFRIENTTNILTSTTISKVVPCLKVGVMEFVVFGPAGTTVGINGTFGTLAVSYSNTLI